ncbi:unnamed protein product [Darwinula stevensoni]|uniref:Uncharacterized protein n=1 Tax=Darwinula stevensoni TaxID=69355 RepID=A0A7R9FTA4_9CRUS|nr:unnamed protein product [Darwinula stevensoni]CAG0904854.1 unnamed protein product [Darwinula stevensoni]
MVKYECKEYHILRGPQVRICGENGEWDGKSPFCEPECGKSVQRVLPEGGKPFENRNYIWQATIYGMEEKHIICGGALIQKQWVLTAAHCAVVDGSPRTRKERELLVYLGKYHQNNSMDDEFVQIRQVSKIVVHEDFNFENYDSDIALLKLTEPAELTLRVQLVCLPSETNFEVENRGKVASWGSNILEKRSAVLMEMELPIISNANCRQNTIYMTGDNTPTHSLTSNMFCAGHDNATPLEEHRTVCPGDSGNPMVFCSKEISCQVVGIVSHFFEEIECSLRRPGQYSIFTKVNRFLSWIKIKMGENEF